MKEEKKSHAFATGPRLPRDSELLNLKSQLDAIWTRYHQLEFLGSDPLEFVHRYRDAPWTSLDQEAVALVSAMLAYGNVTQIRKSVEDCLRRMHSVARGPEDFVRNLERLSPALDGFVHRFNQGRDLKLLFRLLAESWNRYGSLGAHFMSYSASGTADITLPLSALIADWNALRESWKDDSASYFLTSPMDGSCCKRWCMFLRWMGRKDELDPGLWVPLGLQASQLVIPLDTHTGRISQYLGLTERKSLGWKAAQEVTESLKACDPIDPVKYDFALARLGILDLCQKRYRMEICNQCELLTVCRFPRENKNGLKKRSRK